MKRFKKWLLHKLIRHYYNGVTPNDFIQMSDMSEGQMEVYSAKIYQVAHNDAFRNEIITLKYAQEQYLARKAQNADELVFGRACLYLLDTISQRLDSVAGYVETLEATKEQIDKLASE